jgi:hypothetical protein
MGLQASITVLPAEIALPGQRQRLSGGIAFDGEDKQFAEPGCLGECADETAGILRGPVGQFGGVAAANFYRITVFQKTACQCFGYVARPKHSNLHCAPPMMASLDAECERFKKAETPVPLDRPRISPYGTWISIWGILKVGPPRDVPSQMTLLSRNVWEAAAGVSLMAGLTVGAVLYLRRKRPTEEELERARRKLLAQAGRLIDGMLLDVREITLDDGRALTMLEYSYRSSGVDYECSQDITTLLGIMDTGLMRAGFPCTVRYQPGNPQNSIVVSESWSGLRSTLPVFPHVDSRKQHDLGQLRPDQS